MADFIGKTNFFKGEMRGGAFMTNFGLSLNVTAQVPAATLIGIRPEKIQIGRPQETRTANGTNLVEGVIELVSYLGPSTEFRVRIFGDRHVLVQQPNRDVSSTLATGQAVELMFPARMVFPVQIRQCPPRPC